MNLFAEEIEQQAIERIQKFAKIAKTMGFEVCLGFSGARTVKYVTTSVNVAELSLKHTIMLLLKVTLQSVLSVSIIPM